MITLRPPVALFLVFFLCAHSAAGSYPQAQNVTWVSLNFKTVLFWEPEPTTDYSYTVEYYAIGMDHQKNPHCNRISATQCDLSSSLNDLKACYKADVLSEPPLGEVSDHIEFPSTSSPRFCPYKDTKIGRPEFKLKMSKDEKKTTLYVTDPPTALFQNDKQLTIRDIFSDHLQYRVTYRKNKSTGNKVHISKTNIIELTDLDKGVSYCFNVQAFIPSRSIDKQLGELSQTQCTQDSNPSIFEVYSVGVIAAAIFIILLLIVIPIAVTVVCCKRRKNAMRSGKEGTPLRDV